MRYSSAARVRASQALRSWVQSPEYQEYFKEKSLLYFPAPGIPKFLLLVCEISSCYYPTTSAKLN